MARFQIYIFFQVYIFFLIYILQGVEQRGVTNEAKTSDWSKKKTKEAVN